jgi:hypothetical protein
MFSDSAIISWSMPPPLQAVTRRQPFSSGT